MPPVTPSNEWALMLRTRVLGHARHFTRDRCQAVRHVRKKAAGKKRSFRLFVSYVWEGEGSESRTTTQPPTSKCRRDKHFRILAGQVNGCWWPAQ